MTEREIQPPPMERLELLLGTRWRRRWGSRVMRGTVTRIDRGPSGRGVRVMLTRDDVATPYWCYASVLYDRWECVSWGAAC